MDTIKNDLTKNCDRVTKIYCKSFNNFQDSLKAFENDRTKMSDFDLSSLGLYLCKCVEQEINSSVVQLIRNYLGIDMPRYYCRRDPSFSRQESYVDTGRNGIPHRIYFNDYRDPINRNCLKTIPLGDAMEALHKSVEEAPEYFADYPVLNNNRFIETLRYITKLRNDMAHSGTICKRERLEECFGYFYSFLKDYMPGLSVIKCNLAPRGWTEDRKWIDIEPSIGKPSQWELFLEKQKEKVARPKARLENYEFLQGLKKECDMARTEGSNEKEAKCLALMSDYTKQFDWKDIPFKENGKVGLKDIRGIMVVPARYDGFLFLQDLILDNFKFIIAKVGCYYGLVERYSGKEITKFIYDIVFPPRWSLSYYFYKKNGSKSLGLLNKDGQEVVPCIIDQYECLTSGLIIRCGDKYGYYSYYDAVYVPPIYENIIITDVDEPFVFVLNGVEVCISNKGKLYTKDHLEKMEKDDSLEYVEKWDLLMERTD